MSQLLQRRRLLDAAALAALVFGVAISARCGEPAGDPDCVDPVEARLLLDNMGAGVVLPTLESFALSAAALETATAAYASSSSDADRMAAQQAWIDTMDLWQRLEVMQIGPAALPARLGGLGIGEEIYSWPTTSRCRIDQEIVAEDYADPATFAAELVNVRGLDAMEYLLFYDGATNACTAVSPINADGTWDALGVDEVTLRRAAYAQTTAQLVRAQADLLVAAWRPADGDFAGALSRADGAPYPSLPIALNAVSDAMFYLELATKDVKLAGGVEQVESADAHRSRENALSNVRAFEEIFLGGAPGMDGYGFDDLLGTLGEGELATRMAANLTAAIAAIEAIGEPLADALVNNPAAVTAARDAVAEVTADLKGRFMTVLCLQIPAEAGGDTD